MGYRFPRTKYRQTSITEPSDLRFQVQPAQEELTFLNEHNLVGGTFPAARRSNALLYDFHYAAINADMLITPTDYVPTSGDPNATRLPDSGEWFPLSDLTQTWTGGEDHVWAIGWCQYGLTPIGAVKQFAVSGTTLTLPRVQFCLRVNGAVIPESITGTERPDEPAIFMAQPNTPITKTAPDFVTLDTRRTPGTGAFGWHVRAVRVQVMTSVPQGDVTVEFCARRVAPNDPFQSIGEIEPVYIFSRKLCVVQMKRGGAGTFPAPAVPAVTYPTDGDPVSVATLNTAILAPMASTMNNLQSGNIQTWGLRREHLPTGGQILAAAQAAQTSGAGTTRHYPGYGSGGAVGVGNWSEVVDGAAVPLRVTGPWNYSTNPAFVLILANVAFRKAYKGTGTGADANASVYGVYALGGQYTTGSTPFHNAGAEAFDNNPNLVTTSIAPITLTNWDTDTDVPLLLFYDYRSAPPAGGAVDFYRVLAAYEGGVTGSNTWERGSLQVYHFRP